MTVYQNERAFTCDAIATVLGTGPRQYVWTKFISESGVVGDRSWQTRATTTFESAFPPYVYASGDELHLCCFVRGQDSLRTYTTFDNFSGYTGPSNELLPHAYVHNCVASYDDNFTDIGSTARCPGRSSAVNGVDVFENQVAFARILSVGDHLGAVGAMAGGSQLYKDSQTTFVVPTAGQVRSLRVITGVRPAINGTYYYVSDVKDTGDYRILRGMNFNSGQEWLDWCKTH